MDRARYRGARGTAPPPKIFSRAFFSRSSLWSIFFSRSFFWSILTFARNKSGSRRLSPQNAENLRRTDGGQQARSYRSEFARPQRRRRRSPWVPEMHGMGGYGPGLDHERWR